MARPKKLNADYFSHDKDMRNDPRIKAIRRKFSHVGYAVWNYILETLSDADLFEMDWSDVDIEILSGDYDVTPEMLREIVEYCVKLGLLQFKETENGDVKLICKKLVERFSDLLTKRERSAKNRVSVTETPENSEFVPQEPNIYDVSVAQNPQSKVEYSKVNISKDINLSLSPNASEDENLETPVNLESASPIPPGCAAPPKANELPMTELREMYLRKGEPKAEAVMRAVPTICKSTTDVWRLLDIFVNEQISKDTTHKTWLDFQSHFINWIKYQNNEQQQHSTSRASPAKRDMQGVRNHLTKSINTAQAEYERGMAAVGESYTASTKLEKKIL